jgi:hypothetical protein
MAKVDELRQRHPRFTYHKAEYSLKGSELQVSLYYSFSSDLTFTTTLRFTDVQTEKITELDKELLQEWIFQIGMIEAFSYWKAVCSPEFVIEAGYLFPEQITFWDELLKKGLSEFFFVNQIDGWQEGFVTFSCTGTPHPYSKDTLAHEERVLVPVGGGKDSSVTLELLKDTGKKLTTMTVNQNDQVRNVLAVSGVKQNISIVRQLDPKLLQLNQEGYLNGHTPFSAMLAFVSTFAAYIYDYKYVTLSNEFSANEGNTTFLGQHINHQYSKTLEFERNFRQYQNKYLSENIEYFSFLRPLHEIQIAKIFAQYPQYWPVFLSCNRGQKTGKWCGECPKCVFVYIMLSPFVEAAAMEKIFNKNIFTDEKLLPIFEELTGMRECKSLECVGTRQETMMALALTLQKYTQQSLPFLLQYAKDTVLPTEPDIEKNAAQFLSNFETQHFLPTEFLEILQKAVQK